MSRPSPTPDHMVRPRVVTHPKRPQATDVLRRPGEPEPTGQCDQCQWLHGPAGERLWCGAPVSGVGSSWCEWHRDRCFNKG